MPIVTDPLAIVAVLLAVIFFSVQMIHRYAWADHFVDYAQEDFTGSGQCYDPDPRRSWSSFNV